MRTLTLLADRVERSPLARETVNALADGAYWGWAVALLAAAAAWAGRGAPSPGTAALAAAAIAVGVGAAALRSWRRAGPRPHRPIAAWPPPWPRAAGRPAMA
ncbi:hypothetical protein ACFQU9_48395 [Actinomadura namibiensis]|uniref:hypothetical protein n=1 Tax=Actinomadura kijaniata TaxID=46161 RepID=UPI00361EF241